MGIDSYTVFKKDDSIEELLHILDKQTELRSHLVSTQIPYETEDGCLAYRDVEFHEDVQTGTKKKLLNLGRDGDNKDIHRCAQECEKIGGVLSFRVKQDVINSIIDVQSYRSTFIDIRNDKLRTLSYTTKCIMLKHDDIYLGHIWYYYRDSDDYNERYCGIIGIRSSVVNILARSSIGDKTPSYRRGVANKLLNKVLEIAKADGRTMIAVPRPLEVMCHILSKRGFSETLVMNDNDDNDYDDDVTRFLSGIDRTIQYYSLKLDE